MSELQTIIDRFTFQLTDLIESQAIDQARSAVAAAFGGVSAPTPRGRPPKALQAAAVGEPQIP